MPEAPDPYGGHQDHELHQRRREVHDDGSELLRTEDECGERTLDQEERGESNARHEAALAPTRDEIRDRGVEDREDVRDLGEVVVLAGEPRWSPGIDAVEDAVEHEEDRCDEHEEDDWSQRAGH